jgi:hypothetical protein
MLRIKQGKAERVAVTLGATDPNTNTVQVLTGVEVGDTVLTGAALSLTPGSAVRVTSKQDTQQPIDTTKRTDTSRVATDSSRR